MSVFWTTVFAVGAAQGIFLGGALLLRRARNPTATRLLAAFIVVATTMIVVGALIEQIPVSFGHLLAFLNINTELALAPLSWLFVRAIADPARRFARGDFNHLVLPLASPVVWTLMWIVLGSTDRRIDFIAGPFVTAYMVFKAIWLFVYLALSYKTLRHESPATVTYPGARRPVRLHWLRHGFLALIAMAATIYTLSFAERFGVKLPFDSDSFASLVLAVTIYLTSLMVLQRPWVLDLRPRRQGQDSWKQEATRLTTHLELERPWLRPDLNLGDLAEALGSSDNRLSSVLREGLDTSFYALMNAYRLAEFERLAREPSQLHRSVLELAFEAGFNSKASFYRAFRESHETTPTAFRKTVQTVS